MEYKSIRNGVLTTMGLGIAFSNVADFKNINKNASLSISRVLQKTCIEVNEARDGGRNGFEHWNSQYFY